MAKARELGVTENVAILDDGGNLKAFGRMDGAPILCIEMARNKAYTALFGVSTQDFFNFIQGDPSLLAGIPTLARMAAWGGGFPIKVDGEVVGAIGVSGAPTVQNDVDCAKAALALVPGAVPTENAVLSNKGATIMAHTHQTAPTQFVEANGIRFAYRRFGKPDGVPLVFNQHYTGTMDHWDPAVTDGFAKNREVILFNNAGVSSSSGEVPTTLRATWAPTRSLSSRRSGLTKVDVLGFSIGGFVAQEITLAGPRSRPPPGAGRDRAARRRGHGRRTPEGNRIFGATYDPPDHFGLAFTSRRRQRARRRATRFSNAFGFAQRIAIPK